MPVRLTTPRRLPTTTLVRGYLLAFDHVIACGYAPEVDWQDRCRLDQITETTFLRETAWVILSAGMRERVVRSCFPRISEAFLSWSSAVDIDRARTNCARAALQVFRHPSKIAAIVSAARMVATVSFQAFRAELLERGLEFLQRLPYVGPVTRFHLAKNLGMDVVKPDRHLVRLSLAAGFERPDEMCQRIADVTGDRIGTVDLVLWRYATLNPAYARLFERPRVSATCIATGQRY